METGEKEEQEEIPTDNHYFTVYKMKDKEVFY